LKALPRIRERSEQLSMLVTRRKGIGNTLRFELTFDQTELPPMLTALDEVLRAFPVKGSP
jgi:hypothetical protein